MSEMSYEAIKERWRPKFKDKEGNEISYQQWVEKFEGDYRFHLKAYIGRYTIITVWLGLVDLSGFYWETLVALDKDRDDWEVIAVEKHSSKEEADKFHQKMIDHYAHIGFK